MAGGGPFGQLGRIVFSGVLDDGVQHMQRDRRLVRGVFQAAGGSGLRAQRGAFGGDGGFKGSDVRIELGDKGGGESDADELRLKRAGIGGKGAGGIEQGLVAVVVRHEEFPGEAGRPSPAARCRSQTEKRRRTPASFFRSVLI